MNTKQNNFPQITRTPVRYIYAKPLHLDFFFQKKKEHQKNQPITCIRKKMNTERKLLILMCIFHAMVFADAVVRNGHKPFTGNRLVMAVILFVVAYGAAFFYAKVPGRILLLFILVVRAAPVAIVGYIIGKKATDRSKLIAATVVGLIPLVLLGASYASYRQGNMPSEWEPNWIMVLAAIYGGLYWFFATKWVSCISSTPDASRT